MVDVSKIFQRKKKGSSTRFRVISPSIVNPLSDAELTESLESIGSERLQKITNDIKRKEEEAKKERDRLEARLKPYKESRAKIHKAIEETVAEIRKLPLDTLSTEGFNKAKTLYGLLAEMEKNDSELQRLGMGAIYSYKSRDVPLDNSLATSRFLDLIRSNQIFREPKKEK